MNVTQYLMLVRLPKLRTDHVHMEKRGEGWQKPLARAIAYKILINSSFPFDLPPFHPFVPLLDKLYSVYQTQLLRAINNVANSNTDFHLHGISTCCS